ncbi:MAG: HNH endonuclease signature motif containing protein [Dehalococcoidia bacterium]
MPQKSLKGCSRPGCPELTRGRFCKPHEEVYQQTRDQGRPTAASRGYGSRWQQIRKVVLREEPFCRSCSAPSTEVDHIKPMSKGGDNSRGNLQGLCKRCHSSKTGSVDGGFGNVAS